MKESSLPATPSPFTLGRHVSDGKGEIGEKLNYTGERHVLLFGPNGAGKGTRILVPNLLQIDDRSLVVVDPKGELAAITAEYRRTLGEVVILNPFGVLTDQPGYEDLASAGYNPLTALDPGSVSFNSDASWLAEALVTVSSGENPHWDRSARKLIAALIMHVRMKEGPKATLARVRELLTEPTDVAEADPEDPNAALVAKGINATAIEMYASSLPALRNKAGQFTVANKEIESIRSSADTQTEALDDAEIAADLGKSGVDFRDLKKRLMTVYLILPPDMIERHAKWLRLILSSALRGVMRVRRKGELPVMFIIDEFAALGHLPIIETTWALVRGYGIQLMPVFQDLNQLKALYKERWETFIGMAGATVAFGPNDLTTAEWMSKRAGEMTEIVENATLNRGRSFLERSSTSSSYNQHARPYLPVHDLFGTREGHLYLWLAGVADTNHVFAPMYIHIKPCLERARANPYYEG